MGTRRRNTSDEVAFKADILSLAKSLSELYDQAYMLQKPMIDYACKHPEAINQNELEHLFDVTLDILNDNGKLLFDRLCKAFHSMYPECVEDYIRIEKEFNE